MIVSQIAIYIGGALLLIGALFALVAAIGVLRLPDIYTRMHAASKAGTVGGSFILLAVAVLSQDAAVSLRAVIGIAFLLLTTPISAHLLARISYLSGLKPVSGTAVDGFGPSSENNTKV